MKNKDLFDAINNIDEELVNSAGKYLKDGGYFDTDPIEFRPEKRKRSPLKIVAPIAAAVAVVSGAAFILKTQLPKIGTPDVNAAPSDSSEVISADVTTSDIPDNKSSSSAVTAEPVIVDPNDDIPVTLYGPDGKQLTYGDVGVVFKGYNMKTLPAYEMTENNWNKLVTSRFAYIPVSKGAYYNSVDDPEAFTDDFKYDSDTEFMRVSVGDTIGNFEVAVADARFRSRVNDMTATEMSENDIPLSNMFYASYLGLTGNFIAEGYLVKSDGEYYLIPEKGTKIPAMNYEIRDDGSFGTYLMSGELSGFEYKSEIPVIKMSVSPAREALYGKYFEQQNFRKVRVKISNLSVIYDAEFSEPYTVTANSTEIVSIQFGDDGIEPNEIVDAINNYSDITKLKADLIEQFGFTDIRVFRVINHFDESLGEDIPEGELEDGMKVAAYDENGLYGIYTVLDAYGE